MSSDSSPQEIDRLTVVRLSVHDAGGWPIVDPVAAWLRRGEDVVAFRHRDRPPTLVAEVEPGTWTLDVEAGELVSPPRVVEVGRRDRTVTAYLGEKGWPYYRLGENAVPFAPPDDLVAVAFPRNRPDPGEGDRLVREIARRLPLRPEPAPPGTPARADERRGEYGWGGRRDLGVPTH